MAQLLNNFTAHSVFQNKEDINISEYYTVDEVNDLEIYKTPDDIVSLSISIVLAWIRIMTQLKFC